MKNQKTRIKEQLENTEERLDKTIEDTGKFHELNGNGKGGKDCNGRKE